MHMDEGDSMNGTTIELPRESYEGFRARLQAETPDPGLCSHGMNLERRCTSCEDEGRAER